MKTNKTEHTPGPWTLSNSIYSMEDAPVFADHAKPGEKLICECWGKARHANANLIASAPEFYSLIKEFVDYYKPVPHFLGNGHARKMLSKFERILTKAEGNPT